jgi:surfeit locus 1 family protein
MKFKPSPGLTLALLAIGILFARLGFWQLDREQEKQNLFEQFDHAPMMTIEHALKSDEGIFRVEAYGHFDEQRHVLVDNRIFNGVAGVHVLTPFYLNSGKVILVNRGWLRLQPDRRRLPAVTTEQASRTIAGMLKKPSMDGHRLGDPDVLSVDKWPQLVTYLDLDSISAALEITVEPWLLQLDPEDSAGFEGRHWKAAVMGPAVHRAYALQWFSLMVATAIIWLSLSVRRGQRERKTQD